MGTILFIHRNPFNPQQGGAQRVGDNLTKSLQKRGYKILHLSLNDPIEYRNYDYPAELTFFPSNNYMAPENYEFIGNFIKQNNIDIVLNHCSIRMSKLFLHRAEGDTSKKITVVHTAPSGSYSYLNTPRKPGLKEFFSTLWRTIKGRRIRKKKSKEFLSIVNKSDKICLLSNKFKPEFIKLLPPSLSLSNKLMAIANANTYLSRDIDFSKKEKTVIFVGRLIANSKRPYRMIDIWKKIEKQFPDWKLIFVGDGPEKESLIKQANKLNNIEFVGFQDPQPYYESASILCMTSNTEGLGMVLIEALTLGTVPIAFNSFASATDIIEDGKNGFLVKPFSKKEYTKKLSWLMRENEKRKEMGSYGIKSVEKFDIEVITDKWVQVFENI